MLTEKVTRLNVMGSALSMHARQVPHTAVNGIYVNHQNYLSLMPIGHAHKSLYLVQ